MVTGFPRRSDAHRSAATGTGAPLAGGGTLHPGRLRAPGLLMSVLAATAPLMVLAGVVPAVAGLMDVVEVPLVFVVLGVVFGLFSVGYAELSHHVHNAGAFYSAVARGLGGTAGAGAALVALVAYSLMQTAVYGILGHEIARWSSHVLGIDVVWWVPALAVVGVVGLMGWASITLSVRLLGLLLLAEAALVMAFDVAALVNPGAAGLSLAALSPGAIGSGSIGTALCFCTVAFVGFEQAPVYAEETNRAQFVVGRVMIVAVGCAAVFFAVSSWAMTVAAGPDRMPAMARQDHSTLLFGLTEARLGGFCADLLHLLFVTGIFAAALSFHNVVARYAFTMGREGLLPAFLGRTRRTSGAPAAGSLFQSVVSALIVGTFAVGDQGQPGDPTVPERRLFAWMGNTGALGIMVLMVVTCLAVIVFFARRGAARAQCWRLAAAAVAGTALCAIVVRTVRDFASMVPSREGSPLGWLLPGIIGLAAAVGLVQGLVLRSVRPALHARIGQGNQAFLAQRAAQPTEGRKRAGLRRLAPARTRADGGDSAARAHRPWP